jgi:hypothetical protein
MDIATTTRPGPYQFTLRRLFLYVHIAAVACSAFIGIGQILTGNDDDFRVLLTAVVVAVASVCGLGCGAALESKRARIFPIGGLALTFIGAVLVLVMIWVPRPLNSPEWFLKTTAIVCIYAVALSHISLLSIARLAPRYTWALLVAIIAILAVATSVSVMVIAENADEWGLRWVAVAAIIDAAMSVLIPIFHLLSRRVFSHAGLDAPPSPTAIDDEIARLEHRLAELRRMRDAQPRPVPAPQPAMPSQPS